MSHASAKRNDDGFSMPELLLVIVVIAIMAAISVPILTTTFGSFQLGADARSITSSLTYAKFRAVSMAAPCRMSLDLAGNTWKLEKYNKATSAYEVEGPITKLSTGLANSGITFQANSSSAPPGFPTASSTTVKFTSRGIPVDAAGTPTWCAVYLTDTKTQFAATVSLTGKVQLWRYRSGQWVTQ